MLGSPEAWFENAFDAWLVLDAESLSLLGVSARTRSLLGLPPSGPVVPDIAELCSGDAPNDLQTFRGLCLAATKTGEATADFSFTKPDGTTRRFDLRFRAATNEGRRLVTVVGIDVTASAGARHEDAKSGERVHQTVLDNLCDAIYAVDPAGRITYLTASVERLTGRARDELIGRTIDQTGIIAPSSVADALEDLAAVLGGQGLPPRDYEYISASGEISIGEATGCSLRGEDGRTGALFVVRDVTARRREFAERAARDAQARQKQKLEALGTLAAGFAHEMNNPLTGIVNLAELIELDLVEPEGLHDVALRIKSLCDRMTTTVRNLLAFAASDSAAMRSVSLVEATDAVIALATPRLKRERVVCTRHVADGEPVLVHGHMLELQQLLLILIYNACDAVVAVSDLSEERRHIDVGIDRVVGEDGVVSAVLTVTDHGNGIAPEVMARLFEPFYTTKTRDRGVGLGLWVAKGIATDHGGTLECTTHPRVGTEFRLLLPAVSRTSEGK